MLEMMRGEEFDAVGVAGEDENPEILDFTSKVHRVQPELAVFLANDWGVELLMGLESLKDAAFSKAFKRVVGANPGEYLKRGFEDRGNAAKGEQL